MNPKNQIMGDGIGEAIKTFHQAADPEVAVEALKDAIALVFDDNGLTYPVDVVDDMTDYMVKAELWFDQYRAWSLGTATGGPGNDGMYPISNRTGVVYLIPSPAKIQDTVSAQTNANTTAIADIVANMVVQSDLSTYALLDSPTFNNPKANAPAEGSNGTDIPNTSWVRAFVTSFLSGVTSAITTLTGRVDGLETAVNSKAPGTSTNSRLAALETAMPNKANRASPALTGTPTTTAPPANSNNTRIPTTAWVRTLMLSGSGGGGINLPRTAIVTDATYGAKGDGVTDDTAAIQAALNSNNAMVLIPPGVYMVSATINIPSNRSIYGFGTSSRLKLVANVTNNTNVLAASNKSGITIKDIILDGNRVNQPSSNHTTCLQMSTCTDVNLENVHAVGSLIDGLYLHAITRLQVTSCQGYDNGYPGVDASGMNVDTCHGAIINGYRGYGNGFHGLYVSASSNCTFSDIVCHNNSYDGVRVVWGAFNTMFSGVSVYNNGWRGMMFSNGCYSITVTGLQCHENGRHGVACSEMWSLNIVNGFINANAWSGVATSEAGDDVGLVNVALGGNGGGPIEQAPDSFIRTLDPPY